MKIRRTTADALFAKYIRLRDQHCQVCGRSDGKLETSHFWSRRHWAGRHDPRNAVLLCFVCHAKYHADHKFAYEFAREWLGKSYETVYQDVHRTVKKSKVAEAERVKELREMIEALE